MMGKTHKAAGCLAMLLAYRLLNDRGMLLEGVSPLVQLAVMYPACSWASTAPDLDQSSVDTIPEKTPISILIFNILHLGKIKHRSWQTHSLWMYIIYNAVLWGFWYIGYVLNGNVLTTDLTIISMILTGFSVGYASHLIADMFTYEGIPIGGKKHIRLVPHTDTFKTNTRYETIVRTLIYVAILGVLVFDVLKLYNII